MTHVRGSADHPRRGSVDPLLTLPLPAVVGPAFSPRDTPGSSSPGSRTRSRTRAQAPRSCAHGPRFIWSGSRRTPPARPHIRPTHPPHAVPSRRPPPDPPALAVPRAGQRRRAGPPQPAAPPRAGVPGTTRMRGMTRPRGPVGMSVARHRCGGCPGRPARDGGQSVTEVGPVSVRLRFGSGPTPVSPVGALPVPFHAPRSRSWRPGRHCRGAVAAYPRGMSRRGPGDRPCAVPPDPQRDVIHVTSPRAATAVFRPERATPSGKGRPRHGKHPRPRAEARGAGAYGVMSQSPLERAVE